jgi:hypothetical protein
MVHRPIKFISMGGGNTGDKEPSRYLWLVDYLFHFPSNIVKNEDLTAIVRFDMCFAL